MGIRLAVIGTGKMARIRTEAFLANNEVKICGVVSKNPNHAKRFAKEFGCSDYWDDFRKIGRSRPDFLLVEVPHKIQDRMVHWALDHNLPVLIGGPLATSSTQAQSIFEKARKKKLLVEAGYEARYSVTWSKTKEILQKKKLGRLFLVESIALWEADEKSWYYSQTKSGGMPITHLTYAFLNPIRWILGEPQSLSATTHRIRKKSKDSVKEQTVLAQFKFPDEVLYNLTAGFIKPRVNDFSDWNITFMGTHGILEVFPGEFGEGRIRLRRGQKSIEKDFAGSSNPFQKQAEAFLASLRGKNVCRNTPAMTQADIEIAEAISESARHARRIWKISKK